MKCRIRIDTVTDAAEFAGIASGIDGYVIITDGQGLRVNGKSVLGALHAMEFDTLWCESDVDAYYKFDKFIIK